MGGHYRVWCEPDNRPVIGYCRVSSRKQASSLNTQEQIIKNEYPETEIVKDIGSGFNFSRRGLTSVLERAMQGDAVTVVVTTQDRLCRTAFPLLKWLVELHGGSVIALEEDDTTDKFDTRTLLAFLTSFCASHHGKRSGRRKCKDSDIPAE
jgi:predicted site-specific integrase-resolvase